MSQSFIRLSEVQRRTGYSKAWIYRLIKEQRFPQSVKIGSRSIAFIGKRQRSTVLTLIYW